MLTLQFLLIQFIFLCSMRTLLRSASSSNLRFYYLQKSISLEQDSFMHQLLQCDDDAVSQRTALTRSPAQSRDLLITSRHSAVRGSVQRTAAAAENQTLRRCIALPARTSPPATRYLLRAHRWASLAKTTASETGCSNPAHRACRPIAARVAPSRQVAKGVYFKCIFY